MKIEALCVEIRFRVTSIYLVQLPVVPRESCISYVLFVLLFCPASRDAA